MIFLSYNDYPKEPVMLDNFSMKFMKQARFVPLSLKDNVLQIVMADPSDFYTTDALKLTYGFEIEIFEGNPDDIFESTERLYGAGRQSIETIIEEADKDIGAE